MKRVLGLLLMSAAMLCATPVDSEDGAPPSAVPEPATCGLALAGLASLAFHKIRQRSA